MRTAMLLLFEIVTIASFIASIIFLLSSLIFISELLASIKRKLDFKESVKIAFSPIRQFWDGLLPEKVIPIVYILILLGIVHASVFTFCRNETIGSLYEKSSYEAEYQCTLKSWDYDEFVSYEGVATITKSGNDYCITEIKVGRDLSAYYDERYFPDENDNTVTSADGNDWKITLSDEPCSEGYFETIDSFVYSSGKICASKNSDVYHNKRCGYVKNISSSNLIYFPNAAIADLMKYRPCERCGKWWDTK